MEKLIKPTFFKGFKDNVIAFLSLVFGIAPSFVSSITDKKIFDIPLNYLILFLTITIILIVYIIMYIYNVHKFYKYYEKQFKDLEKIKNNNEALRKNLERNQRDTENLKIKYIEYELTINNIVSRIQQGICDISFEEKKYLLNLYSLVNNDKNILINRIESEESNV